MPFRVMRMDDEELLTSQAALLLGQKGCESSRSGGDDVR